MNRLERTRCLNIMNEYYRLHLPDFPVLKSLEVLKELLIDYRRCNGPISVRCLYYRSREFYLLL